MLPSTTVPQQKRTSRNPLSTGPTEVPPVITAAGQPDRPAITAADQRSLLPGALDDEDSDLAVDAFAFGLDAVLDGIASRVASRTARKGHRAQVSGERR